MHSVKKREYVKSFVPDKTCLYIVNNWSMLTYGYYIDWNNLNQ